MTKMLSKQSLALASMLCLFFIIGEGARNFDFLQNPFGWFQIYRVLQFLIVFIGALVAGTVALNLQAHKKVALFSLGICCLGIIATGFSLIPLPLIVSHLPANDLALSGPWSFFFNPNKSEASAWGFVGYNHAYVSLQTIGLLMLWFSLASDEWQRKRTPFLFAVSGLAVFLSESRSGLIVFLLVFGYMLVSTRRYLFVLAAALAALGAFQVLSLSNLELGEADRFIERAGSVVGVLDDTQRTNALSDRDTIWLDKLEHIEQTPGALIYGLGFGSGAMSGVNAHMLYLHVLYELGLAGLIIYMAYFFRITQLVFRLESGFGLQTVYLLILFFVSSSTQETLYPVPALGHYLGLLACHVGLFLGFSANHSEHKHA